MHEREHLSIINASVQVRGIDHTRVLIFWPFTLINLRKITNLVLVLVVLKNKDISTACMTIDYDGP